ncbi:hypothetical protein KAT80_01760 [Candidatus Pacearchaeota archaeon]|nr:hypothetical protein [Candidatus Pacearchaeota archaeon]
MGRQLEISYMALYPSRNQEENIYMILHELGIKVERINTSSNLKNLNVTSTYILEEGIPENSKLLKRLGEIEEIDKVNLRD